MYRNLTLAGVFAAFASAASATPIVLNFGPDQSFADFNVAGNTVDLAAVAPDINARFTALNSWASTSTRRDPGLIGTEDFGISADEGETAMIRLELFDATVGSGFDTLFSSPNDFTWSLVFYDLDSDAAVTSFDEILLRTAGSASVAADTVLDLTATGSGLLASAGSTMDNVATNFGVTTLTPEQQRWAVGYSVQNVAAVEFDYIVGERGTIGNNRRVAFVDGGSLVIDDPVTVPVAPIPLPASALLLLGGMGALVAARRKSA